jgi:hypothetical protein
VLFQHEFVLFQHEFSCYCIENLSTRIFFNTLAISNTGILSVYGLKRCIYLLEITFVLRLFKILSAPSRASASIIEKMAKKFKNLQSFLAFSKVLVQIGHIIACSTRIVNDFHEKSPTFDLR